MSDMEVDLIQPNDAYRMRSETMWDGERFFSVSTTTSSLLTEAYNTPFENTPPQGSQPPPTTFYRVKLEDGEYEKRSAIKQEDFEEEIEVEAELSLLQGLELDGDIDSHMSKILDRMKRMNLTGNVARLGEFAVASGGFCEVWQGVFRRKQVAIKVARRTGRSTKPDKITLKRAAREMSAWGSLKHKHVMPLMGYLVEVGGWVSLVSPWQENGNANDFLIGKSWKIVMNVIVGSCLGLRYLHNKGMIHGDFRGDNILINNEGIAVLNDFGLSKTLQTSLFKTTATAGNPAWTAPEILLSSNNQYEHTYASDVWACGMTTMELFWSQRPFGNVPDGSIVIALHEKTIPSCPGPIHEPIWNICEQCWDFIPDSRLTMRKLVSMLQNAIDIQPPLYTCAISSEIVEGWLLEAPSLTASGNSGRANDLAHAAILTSQGFGDQFNDLTMRSIWCLACMHDVSEAKEADVDRLSEYDEPGINQTALDMLAKLSRFVAVCKEFGFTGYIHIFLDILQQSLDASDSEMCKLVRGARRAANTLQCSDLEVVFRKALLEKLIEMNWNSDTETAFRRFAAACTETRYSGISSELLGETVSLLVGRLYYLYPDKWLFALGKMDDVCLDCRDYQASLKIRLIILDRQKHVLGFDHLDTLLAMDKLAVVYGQLACDQTSLVIRLEILERKKQLLRLDHMETQLAMHAVADTRRVLDIKLEILERERLGEYRRVLDVRLEMLKMDKRKHGLDHFFTLRTMSDVAVVYDRLGETRAALDIVLEVLERKKRTLGLDHMETQLAMHAVAEAYDRQGTPRRALDIKLEILERNKRVHDLDHVNVLLEMEKIVLAFEQLGEHRLAQNMRLEVLERHTRVSGLDSFDTLLEMEKVALSYDQLGNYQDAAKMKLGIYERQKRKHGEQHPTVLRAMHDIQRAYARCDDNEKASNVYGT